MAIVDCEIHERLREESPEFFRLLQEQNRNIQITVYKGIQSLDIPKDVKNEIWQDILLPLFRIMKYDCGKAVVEDEEEE